MTKKLFILLAAIGMIVPQGAWAYDFVSNGIHYIKINSTEVAVTYEYISIGDSYENYYPTGSGQSDIVIPTYVTDGNAIYTVTSINEHAFDYAYNIKSVTIPNSVTSIGESAFNDCSKLTSVTIGNGVKRIGDYAFDGCSKLTSVTIPNSVERIGDYAFDGCTGLTSVTIPNSVTSIGDAAFYGCTSIRNIYISDLAHWCGISGLGGLMDYGTSSKKLFLKGNEIKDLDIPNSVTSIEGSAFRGCNGLTSITIPNSVKNIGGAAFWGCTGLTSITIPNSVVSIGSMAFYECRGLTSIIIPNSVKSIGDYAFYYCNRLTSITIPNNVTSIGKNAFQYCYGLKALICQVTTPPNMGSNNTFGGKKMIFVPAGSISAYKTKWTDFSDYTFVSIPTALFTSKQTAETYASEMASVDKLNATSVVFAGGIDPSLSISKIKEGMNPNCLYYIYEGDNLSGDNVVNVETGEASSIKLTDNYAYNAIRPISVDRVEYVHNPSVWANGKSGWETIVLPFEPTDYIASSAGYLAPITLGAQGNFWLRRFVSASSESVFFTSTLDGRMEANVPYLIAFPGETMGQGHLQGQSITFRASNVDLPMTDVPTLKKGAFTFTGNYDTTADDCTGYALDANGASFVETTIVGKDPFRAYFQKEGGVAAARQLSIKVATDDMDTEGLIGVVKGEGNASAPCYDLQGRTQTQPKSGLYITNGKKVIVR